MLIDVIDKLPIKKISNLVSDIETSGKTPEECCDAAGITLEKVYTTLGELMVAETCIKSRNEELWVPDNRTRMAAVALVLELRKHIKDKSVVTQVGIFSDPDVVARAERVLEQRRSIDV